jgi:hypothetical protein
MPMNNVTVQSTEHKCSEKVQAPISKQFKVLNINESESMQCPMLLAHEGTCASVIVEFRLFRLTDV